MPLPIYTLFRIKWMEFGNLCQFFPVLPGVTPHASEPAAVTDRARGAVQRSRLAAVNVDKIPRVIRWF